MATQGQWTVVSSFGGGLDFSKHPMAIGENQWSWCQNMRPEQDAAVSAWQYFMAAGPLFTPATTILGILPHPFTYYNALLIVGAVGSTVHLYAADLRRDETDGTASSYYEVPWDGVGAAPVWDSNYHTAPTMAFLQGYIVISVGPGGTGYSMLRWTGIQGDPFSTITYPGKTTFRAAYIESFAGHLIACAGPGGTPADSRRVYISDADSTFTWKPAIDNSADEAVLDDSYSGLTGIGLLEGNALGLFTRHGCYALSPTGNIPPFTRHYVGMHPALDVGKNAASGVGYGPFVNETPFGITYLGTDNIYLGLGQAIGTPIYRYLREEADTFDPANPQCPRLLWHPRWGLLICPTILRGLGEFMVYSPTAQAWGQVTMVTGVAKDHAVIHLYRNRFGGGTELGPTNYRHVVLAADKSIWLERETTTSSHISVVDTRDFAISPQTVYVDAVKVDWEPLDTRDTLSVQVAVREQLDPQGDSPTLQPNKGYQYELSPLFDASPAVILAAGESEAPVRARGKWIRLRFQTSRGTARIRGFSVRVQSASDRLVSPNPPGSTSVQVEPSTAWDQSDLEIGKWK